MPIEEQPRTAAEYAERAARSADAAGRIMNDGEMVQFRDRAFEELTMALADLATAIKIIAQGREL